MVSYPGPNWIHLNDPFFAMFPEKCINRMVWLLRTLPAAVPTKEGKPISVLEFFLSMEEENFWSVMDRCPDCTGYLLLKAHSRYWQRKAHQSANMSNQEGNLDIDTLFKSSLKNLPRLSYNRKLLRGRPVRGSLSKLSRSKGSTFISKKNKIRIMLNAFN